MTRVVGLGIVSAIVGLLAVAGASSGERPTAVHYYVAVKQGQLAPGLRVTEHDPDIIHEERDWMTRADAEKLAEELGLGFYEA